MRRKHKGKLVGSLEQEYFQAGIPRIIHQTWHSETVPPEKGDPASWRTHNPNWTYKFWNDEDLRNFIADTFPDLIEMYDGYPMNVQRADLARYCILKYFGGVYADIDTRCLASLEPLAGDHRVVLCEEPKLHHTHALQRGMKSFYFNGTMASPKGHPFWDAVIENCKIMYSRKDHDVLGTTGPLVLTAAVENYPEPDSLSLNSAHLFASLTYKQTSANDARFGTYGNLTISEHLWQGSWVGPGKRSFVKRKWSRLLKIWHTTVDSLKGTRKQFQGGIDKDMLTRAILPATGDEIVTILVPVRNSEAHLERNLEAIKQLDYPRNKIRIVYGAGNSTDNTNLVLENLKGRYGQYFLEIHIVDIERNSPVIERSRRWKRRYQRARRAGIARARNDLLSAAIHFESNWFLWIDSDVVGMPSTLLKTLIGENAKIVTPDCVTEVGGSSYDLNAFLEMGLPGQADLYRYIRHGLLQPPSDHRHRQHLHDLRYLKRVPLHSVGGTALLVHADVHRAGLNFPEIPYEFLIETEAFGRLAHDLGVTPVGLPQISVLHDNS